MVMPAAKMGDWAVAIDIHLIQPPASVPPVPTPHPFNGLITGGLSPNVTIEGKPAATAGSVAVNTPPHLPIGGTFVVPPLNQGRILTGSFTVTINGKPAARAGDMVMTCDDPTESPMGQVVAVSMVLIGG